MTLSNRRHGTILSILSPPSPAAVCRAKNASGDFQLLFSMPVQHSPVIAGLYSVNMFLCVNNSIKSETSRSLPRREQKL